MTGAATSGSGFLRPLGRLLARRPSVAYLALTPFAHPILEILLFGERALQTAHDVFDDDVPRLFSIAADWREFGPSFWDTHLTSGNALFAQFALPPLAPDVLLSFVVPPFVAYSLNAALMTFLAGFAMHLFLRDSLRLPTVACFAGGIASTFSLWHYIYGFAVLLLPLALLWTERAVAQGAPRRHVVLAALLVAFIALSSQVQIVALAAGVVLAWVMVTAESIREAVRRGARYFVPWLAGAALCAPILLTQALAVGDSQRTLWTIDAVASVLGTWVGQLATIPLGIEVANLGGVTPRYGSWFPGAVGLPLLLASIAIPRPHRREKAALGLLAGVLLADLVAVAAIPLQGELGGFLGSFQFVRVRHLIPPLIVINVALAIAWLCRPGAIASLGRGRRLVLAGLAGIGVLALVPQARAIARPVLLWLRDGAPLVDLDQRLLGWGLAGIAFAVGAVALVAAVALAVRHRRAWLERGVMTGVVAACLLVGMAVERAAFSRGGLLLEKGMGTWAEWVPPTPAHEFIAGQPGEGRVLSVIEHANRALSARLETVDGYETIYPVRYHALFGALILPQLEVAPNVGSYFGQWGNRAYAFSPAIRKPVADLLGIRWLYVAPTTKVDPALRSLYTRQAPVDPSFALRFEALGLRVYENPDAFARAFIVHDAATFPDRAAAVAALDRATSPELRTRAYLVAGDAAGISLPGASPGGASDPSGGADAADTVTFRIDTPDRVEVATHAERPGLLVLADTFARGWVAELDGRPAPIVPVDVALRGVALPAGDHVVTFSYRPVETYIGIALSLLTTLALIAWLALPRSRRPTS